jgi:plastocyanin
MLEGLTTVGKPRAIMRKTLLRARLVGILALLAVGCSDSSPSAEKKAGGKPVDPATTGRIVVRVAYQGEVPAPKEIVMSSAPQCALSHPDPVYDQSLLVENGRLRNAIVWVDKGLEGFAFVAPTEAVVVDQKGCIYEPRVAVTMVGQPVEFRNSDTEAHNVHGFPNILSAWNFILSRKGAARTLTFDRSEVAVRIGCDIHPWMRGYLGVTDHPHAAVTSADGAATLDGVPPGELTIAAWHEILGKQSKTVTLAPNGSAEIEFVFAR